MNVNILSFQDEEIERKYYESEYKRIIQVIMYQIYLSLLISILLIIMAFIYGEYILYLGVMSVTLFLPIFIMIIARRFQYFCNLFISFNNISWCILICIVYFWRQDSFLQKCSQNDTSSCSFLFILGGGFYALHIVLLIGTNFILNISTFVIINAIYVFSIFPSISSMVYLIIFTPLCVGMTAYIKEKDKRFYYKLINKYYIWYHLANNILPQKMIITKTLSKQKDTFQFFKANIHARKEYNVNNNNELQQFIKNIDIIEESHQQTRIYDDVLNVNNHMDSIHSKSIAILSQPSKKTITPRQSQRQTTRLVPFEFLFHREINNQNSKNMSNQVDVYTSNQLNVNGNLNQTHLNQTHQNGNFINNQNNNIVSNNLNTTFDQGLIKMNNKKKETNQIDNIIQNIDNPTQNNKESKKVTNKIKLDKYKGIFKSDIEEKRKILITAAYYQKDEQYQLIMVEDDLEAQRDELLNEQLSFYQNLALSFSTIIQNEQNLLQFYLHQIKQNFQIQKNINNFLYESLTLNQSLINRIFNFQDFFNIERNNLEINPKQFSLKKLIKDITSTLDFRIKYNQIQLVISNNCQPQQDNIFNDEKKIKHILNYLLNNCITNTQKGQIIISTSSGAAEIGDVGDLVMQGSIKIHIRDNSSRKYQPIKMNKEFIFRAKNLLQFQKNKIQNYSDIEPSVCKQILQQIGPQGNIFYESDEKNNLNKVSFYIYTNILEGDEYELSKRKVRELPNEDNISAYDDNQVVKEQIKNSEEDTFQNNYDSSNSEDNNQIQNEINLFQNSNLNPYSNKDYSQNQIHNINENQSFNQMYHSTQKKSSQNQNQNGVEKCYNNQGSGFQSSHQLQKLSTYQQSNSFSERSQQNLPQQQNLQQSVNQNQYQQQTSFLHMQQSSTQFSSTSDHAFDKIQNIHKLQTQTLPERIEKKSFFQKKQSELRKSTSQLFEENERVDDENSVSEVYIKELSHTNVKFKREISRTLTQKTNNFKHSTEDFENNSKLNNLSRINNPIFSNQFQNSGLNNISISLIHSLIIIISIFSILTQNYPNFI